MQHTLFYTLLVLICFSPKIANTQNFDINWSDTQKSLPSSLAFDIIGLSDDTYYTLIYGQKNFHLQANKYNHDLLWQQKFPRKKNSIKLLGIKHLALSSGDYFVFKEYNRKTKQWQYNFTSTDKPEFQERQPLANINIGRNPDPSVKLGKDIRYYKDKDIYPISKDHNIFALMNHIPYRKKQNEDRLNIHVFDSEMQLLWQIEKSFPFSNQRLSVVSTLINQQGQVWVLTKLIPKKSPKKRPANYPYILYKFTQNGVEEYDINLKGDYKTYDAKLLEQNTNNEHIIVTGLYVNTDDRYRLDGVFFNTIDRTTGKQQSTTQAFEPAVVDQLIDNNKDQKSSRSLSQRFTLQNTFSFDNGNFGFITEEYYYHRKTYYHHQGGTSSHYTNYYSNNFLINIFTPEGDVKMTPILKKFSSKIYPRTSPALAQQNDRIFVFYNTISQEKFIRFNTSTDMAIIDDTGNLVEQKKLFTKSNIDFTFYPHTLKQKDLKICLLKTGGYRYQVGIMDLRY